MSIYYSPLLCTLFPSKLQSKIIIQVSNMKHSKSKRCLSYKNSNAICSWYVIDLKLPKHKKKRWGSKILLFTVLCKPILFSWFISVSKIVCKIYANFWNNVILYKILSLLLSNSTLTVCCEREQQTTNEGCVHEWTCHLWLAAVTTQLLQTKVCKSRYLL